MVQLIDLDAFEELAAILEFDEGMSRYQAESQAAGRQGFKRWEALNAIKQRNSARGRDIPEAAPRDPESHMSRVQPKSAKEAGQVPSGNIHVRRGGVVLPSLRP